MKEYRSFHKTKTIIYIKVFIFQFNRQQNHLQESSVANANRGQQGLEDYEWNFSLESL